MNHPACLGTRRARAAAAVALSLLLCTGSLAACAPASDEPADTAAPPAPVTMPDLADDRTPTAPDRYAALLDSAFAETPVTPAEDFTYEFGADGVTVTGYTGGEVVLNLPAAIEGRPVTAIAAGAFAGKGSLQAVALPDTVVSVGKGAFADCDSLTTLRTPVCVSPDAPYFGALFGADTYEINASAIPSVLETLIVTGGAGGTACQEISDYCFYDCPMTAVSLPASLLEIGDFAFYGCDRLAYIPLSHTTLLSVGDRAFTNCRALLELDLPATVDAMGFAMLEGCGALESLTIPFVGGSRIVTDEEDLPEDADKTLPLDTRYLGYLFGAKSYTFTEGYLPASLIRVTLREGCTDIPANAFFDCSSIREVVIPEGVTGIGRRAFYGCARLSTVTLPASVEALGDDAFHGCIRMVTFAGGEGLCTLGVQAFMDCLSLRTVTLPASVTHLPNSAFAGCRSLETLTAPGVKTVGRQAFRHCDKLQGWEIVEPTID